MKESLIEEAHPYAVSVHANGSLIIFSKASREVWSTKSRMDLAEEIETMLNDLKEPQE